MKLTPQIISAIGRDAGNASAKAAGRATWSRDDYNAAVAATEPLWAIYDTSAGA